MDHYATAERDRIPFHLKLVYGLGAFVNNLLAAAIGGMVIVLNLGLGMNPALVGLLGALPRLTDAITDPLMGFISDNTRSRWGRRRPYIFVGAIAAGIIYALLWQLPEGQSETFYFWYFLVGSFLFYLAYTVFATPWVALGYELTPDYHERTRLMGVQNFVGQIPYMIAPYFLAIMYNDDWFSSEVDGAAGLSLVIAVFVIAIGILPAIFLRERLGNTAHAEATERRKARADRASVLSAEVAASDNPESIYLRSYVGSEDYYYLERWSGLMSTDPTKELRSGARLRAGFNWAAFLFAPFWLIYRKMWVGVFLYVTTAAVLDIGLREIAATLPSLGGIRWLTVIAGSLIPGILVGVFANRWYFSVAREAVSKANSRYPEIPARIATLMEHGGTIASRFPGIEDFFGGFAKSVRFAQFLKLCLATFLVFNGFILIAAFQSYVIIYYVFGGDAETGSKFVGHSGLLGAISTLLVIVIVTRLSTKIGKRRAFFLSTGISMLGYSLKWVCYNPEMPWLVLLPAPLMAFGLGGLFTLMPSMIADVVDMDELDTRERREGMYGSIFWWVVKLGMAAAIAGGGFLLNATGFDVELGGDQSERAIVLMRLFDVFVPATASAIAIWAIATYSITEEKAHEIRVELESRRGAVATPA